MGAYKDQSALLIVDMIHDFVHPEGALQVPKAIEIIDRISELARSARDLKIPVIYVNDSHDPDDREFENWPEHAVVGTRGSQVVTELEPHEGDHVIPKKRFSAFFETDLDQVLKDLSVGHLVITGTLTNICVMATAIDALMRGYDVTIPEDAVAALSDEEHDFTLRQIDEIFGGEVL